MSATSRGGRFIRCASALLAPADRECIQRTSGGAEMPPGEMQIDRRFLEVTMSEQHLDGSQVGAGFQQMGGKAVAQGVGMDALVLKAGALRGALTAVQRTLVVTG
jgi:hypothetical protein